MSNFRLTGDLQSQTSFRSYTSQQTWSMTHFPTQQANLSASRKNIISNLGKAHINMLSWTCVCIHHISKRVLETTLHGRTSYERSAWRTRLARRAPSSRSRPSASDTTKECLSHLARLFQVCGAIRRRLWGLSGEDEIHNAHENANIQ